MNKMHTICDLCEADVTGVPALEIRAAYLEMHVCADCLQRPIWDLAEKVRCLQVAQAKEMEASCMPTSGRMLQGLASVSAPQLVPAGIGRIGR
jgi:hypothetical protein